LEGFLWKKKLLYTVALICILVVTCPLPAAEKTSINVMALAGTTGLSLVKMFEENPVLAPGVTLNYTVLKSPD